MQGIILPESEWKTKYISLSTIERVFETTREQAKGKAAFLKDFFLQQEKKDMFACTVYRAENRV